MFEQRSNQFGVHGSLHLLCFLNVIKSFFFFFLDIILNESYNSFQLPLLVVSDLLVCVLSVMYHY